MKTEDILTKTQIDKIKALNEDLVLKDALYKIFLSPIYAQGVIKKGEEHNASQNFALTPAFNMLLQKREMWDLEKLGADTLASAKAVQMIEQGFGELEKFKNEKPEAKENEDESPI